MKLIKLRNCRVIHNFTQKNVADKLGFSRTFYFMLENGSRSLSYVNAIKIASIFGMKPDALFYEDFKKGLSLDGD